jgi:hypothetical protein
MTNRLKGTLLSIVLAALVAAPAQSQVPDSSAPYNYWLGSYQAQHGSPNDSDAQVPIIFCGNDVKPGRYGEFGRVVDIAPILAAIVHAAPQEKLDGHVLQNAIR